MDQLQQALTSADCIDHRGKGCTGEIMHRTALSATGTSFVRCDGAWRERLEFQHGIDRRYPDRAPAGFDPSYAGESWD